MVLVGVKSKWVSTEIRKKGGIFAHMERELVQARKDFQCRTSLYI